MQLELKNDGFYKYIDEGQGEILLLLHGLFGALSNWEATVSEFSKTHRVIIPLLPIYDMPLKTASVEGLVEYVEKFVDKYQLKNVILLGNSLGGHVSLIYALNNRSNVKAIVLTGSSGLFENTMGGSYPKRGNYEYVRERVAYTFYDPNTASKELVDEVYEITNSIPKCLRIISIAKSAQRQNLSEEITKLTLPTLLIWGLNDNITPPEVAHQFMMLMPKTVLRFIDKCGHAPMMEQPILFNSYLRDFLNNI